MKKFWTIISVLFILFCGCASPGKKFIHLDYLADHEKTQTGIIGVAPFHDKRPETDQGYIGYRNLLDNSQETYFVNESNLAEALTRTIIVYFQKNGFTTSPIPPWDLTPKGVSSSSKGFQQIISGQINKFECRAKKKLGATEMVLDIDLTLFLGISEKNILKTIPVSMTIERTELTFTRQKLERFVNQALEEIIQKAFAS